MTIVLSMRRRHYLQLSCALHAALSAQSAFFKHISNPLRYSRLLFNGGANNPIQSIYDCLDSIPDIQQSSQNPLECLHIQSVRNLMSEVTLNHVGLDRSCIDQLQSMQCMTVAHTEFFDIAIFMVPKGQRLPLHDHPNMTVISKVLEGTLRVRSYSSLPSADVQTRTDIAPIIVSLEDSCTKQSTDKAWLLSPTVGNFHEFAAESTCIIFDVLLPPYLYPHRPCNFYELSDYRRDDSSSGDSWKDRPSKPLFQLKNIPERVVSRVVELPYSVSYRGIRPVAAKSIFGRFR